MSQQNHKIIADCVARSEELVKVINQYKKSAELNVAATESLEKVAKAINRVSRNIAPLMSRPIKLCIIIFGTITVLNTVLIILMLLKIYQVVGR